MSANINALTFLRGTTPERLEIQIKALSLALSIIHQPYRLSSTERILCLNISASLISAFVVQREILNPEQKQLWKLAQRIPDLLKQQELEIRPGALPLR